MVILPVFLEKFKAKQTSGLFRAFFSGIFRAFHYFRADVVHRHAGFVICASLSIKQALNLFYQPWKKKDV